MSFAFYLTVFFLSAVVVWVLWIVEVSSFIAIEFQLLFILRWMLRLWLFVCWFFSNKIHNLRFAWWKSDSHKRIIVIVRLVQCHTETCILCTHTLKLTVSQTVFSVSCIDITQFSMRFFFSVCYCFRPSEFLRFFLAIVHRISFRLHLLAK